MKKRIILFSIFAGLTSIVVSSLLASSSVASSVSNQRLKQVQQADPSNNTLESSPASETQPATPAVPDAIPTPEVLRFPVTTVEARNGVVDVRLVNQTNVPVWYSVLGDTDSRMLPAQSDVYLSGLNMPVEMTFYRDDAGFVTANPLTVSSGVLELQLDETANFSDGESGLIIQETGDVIIN